MGLITYHLFNVSLTIVMGCRQQWDHLLVCLFLTVEIKDHKISTNNCKNQRLRRPTINSKCKDEETTIKTKDQQILAKTKDQESTIAVKTMDQNY